MGIGIVYTHPTDNVTPLTVASAFDRIDAINNGLTSHLKGEDNVVSGVPRHTSAHINQGVLAETTIPVSGSTNPGTQKVLNDTLAGAIYYLVGPAAGAGTGWGGRVQNFTTFYNLTTMLALLQAHDHATSTTGTKLAQANTHQSADTDSATTAIHHTLGTGANQAATGTHLHTGVYVPVTDKGAANGVATLDSGTLIPVAQIPSTIARVTDISTYVTGQKGIASGLATLDGTTHVPIGQIPSTVALVASTSVLGHVHGVTAGEATITTAGLTDGAVVGGTGAGAKIAQRTVALANVADGAVTAQVSPNMTVNVAPYSYYNSTKTYGAVSGTSPTYPTLPTAGNSRYDLLYADDTFSLGWKQGTPSGGTPSKPTYDDLTKPLALVLVTNTTTSITQGMITDARPSPSSSPQATTAGSSDLSGKPFVTVGTDGTLTGETDIFLLASAGYAPGTLRNGSIDLSTWRVADSMQSNSTTDATNADLLINWASGPVLDSVILGSTGNLGMLVSDPAKPIVIQVNGRKRKITATTSTASNGVNPGTLVPGTSPAGNYQLAGDVSTNAVGDFRLAILAPAAVPTANQLVFGTVWWDGNNFQLGTNGGFAYSIQPILDGLNFRQRRNKVPAFHANGGTALPTTGAGDAVLPGATAASAQIVVSQFLPVAGLTVVVEYGAEIVMGATAIVTQLIPSYSVGSAFSAPATYVSNPVGSNRIVYFGGNSTYATLRQQARIENVGPGWFTFGFRYAVNGATSVMNYVWADWTITR